MHGIYEKFMERCGKPIFHADDMKNFLTILETIYNSASSSDYVRDMKIFESLTALLTQIMRQSWQPLEERFKTTSKLQLTGVKEYLDTHFQEKITLDELSSKFYINKFYLSRVFKKEYGVSIMSYVLQNRITKAKQLLRFSDKTLTAIALEVGFPEPYYFSRIFKQLEGISPSEYRKSWQG